MVGNFNILTRWPYTDAASDFGRLSGPGQFVCRFLEEVTYRLVWKARGEKHFKFIYPELTEAEGITPAPMARLMVFLQDRDVIAYVEVGEGAILPI